MLRAAATLCPPFNRGDGGGGAAAAPRHPAPPSMRQTARWSPLQTVVELGPIWAAFCDSGPNLDELAPSWRRFETSWPGMDRVGPNLLKIWPNLGQHCPNVGGLGTLGLDLAPKVGMESVWGTSLARFCASPCARCRLGISCCPIWQGRQRFRRPAGPIRHAGRATRDAKRCPRRRSER